MMILKSYIIYKSVNNLNEYYGGTETEVIDDYFTTTITLSDLGLSSPLYFRVDIIDSDYSSKQSNVVKLERDFKTYNFSNSTSKFLYFNDSKQFVLSSGYSMYYINCSSDEYVSGSFSNSQSHDYIFKGFSVAGVEELWQLESYYLEIFSLSSHNNLDNIYLNI
ncbi:MAG: hypothetical protein JEZ09_17970 [Salinivirgaceae bacterium]|nr:hypothetical protein [Salinivirgaceae bacterium]